MSPNTDKIPPTQHWFESIEGIAMPSPHRRAVETLFSAKQLARHARTSRQNRDRNSKARVIPKTDLDVIAR